MNVTSGKYASLFVQGLEIAVNLGWPENERKEVQTVLLDIEIHFSKPPLGCTSDNLKDSLCYAELTQRIKTQICDQSFHLIEYLAQTVYQLVKAQVGVKDKVMIKLTKHPKIAGLKRGVCFCYGDKEK